MSYFLLFFVVKISLVVCIFWAIVFANSFFFKLQPKNESKQIYECGFKSYKNISIDFNINFFLSVALVLLYELELLFFVPLMLNLNNISLTSFIVTLILIFTVFITFFFDIKLQIIKWVF